MKNYYNILEIEYPSRADNTDIKRAAKFKINQIKNSNLKKEEKIKYLKLVKEAYDTLKSYHKRREYDNKLNNNSLIRNNLFSQLFNKNIFNEDFFDNLEDTKNTYHYSSYSSTQKSSNGKYYKEEKIITNKNGKIDKKHTITTKNKNGDLIVKNIPENINLKLKDKN